MRIFLSQFLVLLKKELLSILKNPKNRIILIMPIVIQCLIFGYVATFDLNSIEYAVLDEDKSHSSRELIAFFDGSPIFKKQRNIENAMQITQILDNKEALLLLHIKEGFEKKLNNPQDGKSASVQILVDGRNSNVAGIAQGYANLIIENYNAAHLETKGIGTKNLSIETRAWFNPNLETRWNIMAGMLAILGIIQIIVLSAQSIAIEKEQGTFDQLLVTPLEAMTILIGKSLPPIIIGLIQSSIVLLISQFWFNIYCAGSYILLFFFLLISNFAVVGFGLCISVFATTMQQALLYTFSSVMPMILLSGFLTPIDSMPEVLQYLTLLNPARYSVEIVQRIYLEGSTFFEIYHLLIPLVMIGSLGLFISSKLFRSHLD